ncbi:MAG: AAA family ATPase [Candidatus Eremiobacteraeota bacterium]|nr:AAA family ATPase [Candidatus Eremiobacteraeota bacterium]
MLTRALVSPTLVGRDEQLAELVELRLAAARGHGTLVLISGDAGIGKTRLLQAFRKTLRGGRAALGIGLCREFGNQPYGPVRDALQTLEVDADSQPASSREEQLECYSRRLVQACRRRHVVMLIEDIHWADDGTLLFLHYLLPALASLRLLVVATYRTDEASRVAQLEPHVARLIRSRSTGQIALSPLAPDEMRRLVKLAAGAKRRLPPPAIEEIVERSDGNPLFAEELLKNTLENSAKTLPFSVRATVLERVAGLDEQSRAVLSLASVLGRRFDANFLADLAGMDVGELLPIVRRLRNLQLIDELDADSLNYTFRHALTREAIYGELLTAEVRALHGRIVRILEDRNCADLSDLGYHAWAANDATRGLHYNERAGDEAHAVHAYGVAAIAFTRAVEFARDPHERGRLFAKAAHSSQNDGKSVQAADFYGCAIEALRQAGETAGLPEIYREMSAQARIGGDTERAIEILTHARETVDDDASPESATLGLGLAYLLLDRGEVREAYALIEQCSAAAGTLDYYKVTPYAALVAGDVEAWRTASARLVAASQPLGAEQTANARFNIAFGNAIFGFDAAATREFESLLSEVHRLRLSSLEVLASANLALIYARAGRFVEARRLLESAGAIPEPSTTGPIALAAAALTVGYGLWDESLVGNLCSDDVLEIAFRSRINSTLGRIAGPYARWLHARGEIARAQSVLASAMNALPAACGATESFLAAAELGDAATQAAAFERIALLDSMPQAPVYIATAAHLRALQAHATGCIQATHAFARDALAHYRTLGWPLHQAHCRELLGEPKRAVSSYRRLQARGPMRAFEPRDNGVQKAAVLSVRERQVASLVANGTVNKQIAELLAINQRTVEKYLTSIYGKLGLRNRSELAAFIARSAG